MTHDLGSKAVKNFFFIGARLVIGTGSVICTSAVIARTLGPSNMGIFGYAMWLVGALGVIANLGLPTALTKYVSQYIGSGDIGTATAIARRLLVTQVIVAASVSGLTACFVFIKSPYGGVIALAAAMILAQALQQGLSAALAGAQRFDKIALISLYAGLASLASVGIAALLHARVLGMLWATLGGSAVGTWLTYLAVDESLLRFSPHPPNSSPNTANVFRRIHMFSFTVSYILLLDAIVWQRSEVLFLKWRSTLPEIAFYTLAYSIASKVGEIGSIFSGALLPLCSESYGRSGLRDMGTIFVKGLKYLQMVMVPLCFMGAAVAKPLVALIFGPKFLPVVVPLQILLASLAFTSVGTVVSPLVVGTEKQSFTAKFGTVVAALNVTLDLVLIPGHGALGAAIANCTAQIAGVLGGTFFIVRHIRTAFPWRTTCGIYCATAVAMAPLLCSVNWAHLGSGALVASLAAGVVLYPCALSILGQLSKRDILLARGALFRKVMPQKCGSPVTVPEPPAA